MLGSHKELMRDAAVTLMSRSPMVRSSMSEVHDGSDIGEVGQSKLAGAAVCFSISAKHNKDVSCVKGSALVNMFKRLQVICGKALMVANALHREQPPRDTAMNFSGPQALPNLHPRGKAFSSKLFMINFCGAV